MIAADLQLVTVNISHYQKSRRRRELWSFADHRVARPRITYLDVNAFARNDFIVRRDGRCARDHADAMSRG